MSYAARQEIDALQEALSAWFARRVDRSVRRSTDQTWFAEHTRPRYPAGRDLELIPSPGRVTFHGPGGQWWHDPLLDRVVCMTWAPRGALAAGLLAGPGDKDLRLWFADPARRTVRLADTPASIVPQPVWAGPDRVVFATPFKGDTPPRAPWIFESAPGAHVRVLPPAARQMPVRLMASNGTGGTIGELNVPAAPYQRLAAIEGWVAALAITESQPELTLAEIPDRRSAMEAPATLQHPLDGWPQSLCWSPATGHPRLIMAVQVGQNLEIRSLHPDEGSWHTSWREPAAVIDVQQPMESGAPALLVQQPSGDLLLLRITAKGARAHAIADLPATPAIAARHTTIAQVRADQDRVHLALADLQPPPDQPRLLTLSSTEPGDDTGTLRATHNFALEPEELLLEVTDWDNGLLDTHGHRPGKAPRPRWAIPTQLGDGEDAQVVVHPPSSTASASQRGTLVWIEPDSGTAHPNGGSIPETAGPILGDSPIWHTQHGYAVVKLRLTLGWWTDTADADLRPRIVKTAVAALSRTGSGDPAPRPWIVGGHSFGATLALLLLAETDLMAAGMIRSGAYSRQLTMLGFQAEHRTMWQAPIVYRDFDAICHADQIRQPVLISHGLADTNPATPVQQAFLLYQALTANDTPSRLVILPYDGHAYRSHDGITTILSEEATWLHRWT